MANNKKGLWYKFFPNKSNDVFYIKQRVYNNGIITKEASMPGLKFDTREEALKKCEQLEKRWNRYDITDGERDEQMTISELIAIYLPMCRDKFSFGDFKQKRSTFNNHVMPVIGDIQLGQITRRTIMKYREHLVGLNNAENTKFHKFSNLSAMFTWAIERGYIEHNPCRLVDWPRRGATDNSHLEDWGSENMMKLMLWIDANHPRDRAFFEVMTQGVERGAVAGMRIRDFKIEESVVVLEQNILDIVGGQPKWGIVKGRKREVPVDTEQYKIISNHIVAQGRFLLNEYGIKQTKESPLFNRYYLARQETDLIKSGEEIQWLDPDWITVTSKRNTAGAGLHPVKPHEWRKVLRTIHRELGISIDDSAELLGNTVLTVAKYYTPKSSETLKRNAQKVLELKQKRLKDMNVEQITKHASNDG